jgi:hypothetical protein
MTPPSMLAAWRCVVLLASFVGGGLLTGCGGSPGGPTPLPPVPNPPIGTAPVIASITLPVSRAEVGQDVTVTAAVQDAETPASALTYVWTANAGTFSGTGSAVTWRLSEGTTTTPIDVAITLTVVEPYQAIENGALVNREHRITRQASSFRVHDSEAEISRMAIRFLVDLFGDSSKSPDQCLADFWPACPGTTAERDDIVKNRAERLITSVEARVDRVTFNGAMTTADAVGPCTFRDIELATGKPWVASGGTCRLTAVYHDARWWLCSSEFVDYTFKPAGASRSSRPVSSYWRSSVPEE